MEKRSEVAGFLVKVTFAHVVTYFLVGIVAATVLDYESLFAEPVVREYMREFGSIALFVGPLVQVVRGIIVAAVLLPFRGVLATRFGWLWLWLLLVGIAILSTAAAAPSSIEGVVYTRLPLWYHLIGLPEMLVQTLLFSVLTGLVARHPQGVLAALPPVFERLLRALVSASLAFVGYAVVSVLFALMSGAEVDAGQSLTLKVQGLFIVPFFVNGVIAYAAVHGLSRQKRLAGALTSYVVSALAILAYQAVITGMPNLLYALVAPVLPALILWLLMPRVRARGALPEASGPRGSRSPADAADTPQPTKSS
jgi:hypothetical protein